MTLLASLAFAAPAAAQLTDGGFDTQGSGGTDYCYFGGTCPAGSWSGSGSGFGQQGSTSWPLGTLVSPYYTAFVQSSGYLSKSFTVPTSGTYRLSWWDAGRVAGSGYGGNQTYTVKINAAIIASMSTMSGQGFIRRVSAPFSLSTGTTYTLTFQGTTSTNDTAFIDSVGLALANGAESKSYSYDALGRLVATSTSGGINNGVATSTTFDPADNRSNYSVTGVPTP